MSPNDTLKTLERPWIDAARRWSLPLVLPASARRGLERWALAEYPREACGLLVGAAHLEGVEVARAELARNLERERAHDRFVLAPEDWLRIEEAARADGLDVVGVWHSHPDHPALPSVTDLAAAWEGYAYLILRVECDRVAEWRSWQLESGRFLEQAIELGASAEEREQ